jgi:hypothetical protein
MCSAVSSSENCELNFSGSGFGELLSNERKIAVNISNDKTAPIRFLIGR